MARKWQQGDKEDKKETSHLKSLCTVVKLYYHISAFQGQQEKWTGKVLLFVGNVKLEGRDVAAFINLMSCLGNVKKCQAFAAELNWAGSTAFQSEPNCVVEKQKI